VTDANAALGRKAARGFSQIFGPTEDDTSTLQVRCTTLMSTCVPLHTVSPASSCHIRQKPSCTDVGATQSVGHQVELCPLDVPHQIARGWQQKYSRVVIIVYNGKPYCIKNNNITTTLCRVPWRHYKRSQTQSTQTAHHGGLAPKSVEVALGFRPSPNEAMCRPLTERSPRCAATSQRTCLRALGAGGQHRMREL
jgi:hypothetical protein